MEQFHTLLRAARRSLGLTRRDLAALAHVSQSSLLAYELQRRHPSRDTLQRVLDALSIDRYRRNELLAAAGYAVEAGTESFHARVLTFDEARADVEARPWVSFLLNELIEIRAASPMARALWAYPPEMLASPARRSMLAMLTQPWYADRKPDWETAAQFHIGLFKARVAPGHAAAPSAYVSAILAEVERGKPALVSRFFELWDATPPMRSEPATSRHEADWRGAGVTLRFHVLVNMINERDALYTSDWVPADERSCTHVAALQRSLTPQVRRGVARRRPSA